MFEQQSERLIDMTNISFRRNGVPILTDLTWRMNRGEQWAVIGANGSGKTTLLKIVGATLFPSSGEAAVLGERFGRCDLLRLRQRIGWVGPALLARMPPEERLWDIVASGFKATFGLVYEISPADAQRVDEALERTGLRSRAVTPFAVLSQGEQQRALFARSMLTNPELYILDEACSGLDLPAREMFLRIAGNVMSGGGNGESGAGIVMVTHHIEEIPAGITHALILKSGARLASGPLNETITPETLSEAFGMRVAVEKKDGRFWARMI